MMTIWQIVHVIRLPIHYLLASEHNSVRCFPPSDEVVLDVSGHHPQLLHHHHRCPTYFEDALA